MVLIALISLVVAIAGAYFTYRSQLPKKRVLEVVAFGSRSVLPNGGAIGSLEIWRNGEKLSVTPYTSIVEIKCTGRHDVSSTNFDRGTPIEVLLTAKITEVVYVASRPSNESIVPHKISPDGVLQIGPGLIRRGQTLTFQVLTTEQSRGCTVRAELVDVDVKVVSDKTRPQARRRSPALARLSASFFVASTAMFVSLVSFLGVTFQMYPGVKTLRVVSDTVAAGEPILIVGDGFSDQSEVDIFLGTAPAGTEVLLCSAPVNQVSDNFIRECDIPVDWELGRSYIRVAVNEDASVGSTFEVTAQGTGGEGAAN